MTLSTERSTFIGACAPLLWATVPLAALVTTEVPPYQAVAITFWVSALLTVLYWRYQGKSILAQLRLPSRVWALGIFGLFGFYLFHFIALRQAPAVEAILLINLWPLCMVVLSSLLERKPLRWWHIVGIGAGFGGILVLSASHGFRFDPRYWHGYLAAVACALVWSIYSVLSRRMASQIPDHAIGCFCISNAVLLTIVHFLFESTVQTGWSQNAILIYMGLLPMGLAYYAWDHGIRNGDVRVLGGLSYLGPVVGSGLLILFSLAPLDPATLLAGALILGGAFFSSWFTFHQKD